MAWRGFTISMSDRDHELLSEAKEPPAPVRKTMFRNLSKTSATTIDSGYHSTTYSAIRHGPPQAVATKTAHGITHAPALLWFPGGPEDGSHRQREGIEAWRREVEDLEEERRKMNRKTQGEGYPAALADANPYHRESSSNIEGDDSQHSISEPPEDSPKVGALRTASSVFTAKSYSPHDWVRLRDPASEQNCVNQPPTLDSPVENLVSSPPQFCLIRTVVQRDPLL
jgi:hypothetical protein